MLGHPLDQKRAAYRLAKTVQNDAPNNKGELEKQIFKDGTVERLRVRIYRGAELSLRLVPYVRDNNGHKYPLVEQSVIQGEDFKTYLDGDDDWIEFTLSYPIPALWWFGVEYENVSGATVIDGNGNSIGGHPYNFACDVEIDYANGQLRA